MGVKRQLTGRPTQLLPITMSLATLRAHVWKGGSDIVLHYKGNGRKEIPMPPPPTEEEAPAAEAPRLEQTPVTAAG